MLEKFYLSKEKILKKSQEFFSNSNSLIPKIGCELEFFLLEKDSRKPADIAAVNDFALMLNAEKEQGSAQIEIKTNFTSDLHALCEDLENRKKIVQYLAAQKNLLTNFAAQPFVDDCGNALQFSISLHDENDKNIFVTEENLLKNYASSLLTRTDEMMIFLAPQAEDYERFSLELNKNLFKKGKFTAPINLSFGADNRTCAIRVPSTSRPSEKERKRLEYRIASASADPWLCISALLLAMENKNCQHEQIFGNAFDGQYKLESFSKNLEEAEKNFWKEGNFIREKFSEFCA